MNKGFRFLHRAVSLLLPAVLVVVGTTVTAFAWFALKNRFSRTAPVPIDVPPVIYIKDDHLQEMTSFKLDGLKVGKEHNALFCVSPTMEGIVKTFFLGVIYTENLGMKINLYPVTSVTDAAESGPHYEKREITLGEETQQCYFNYSTEQKPNEVTVTYGGWSKEENSVKPVGKPNSGIYKAYYNQQFENNQQFEKTTVNDSLLSQLNNTNLYRFYVLHITWDELSTVSGNDKETDIVYIVTKGTND